MGIDYVKEGRVATFTINRREALNALNLETLKQLSEAMMDFRDDPDLWVGIVTGAGNKAFCVGADVREAVPFIKSGRGLPWAVHPTPMRRLEVYKPLIAAVNGMALGGGLEVVQICDLRIASETATFGQPEVKLGLVAGLGGTQRLPRMLPWCQAAELLLLGKPIDAQEAYRIGLVNKVVPPDQLMPTAKEWAQALCEVGPVAVRKTKEAMLRGTSMSLDEGLRLENDLSAYSASTEDFAEGTSAFFEKRKPDFKGK
ncbi:MAG: enoyl-CoA hydratase-related protein [Chloroflexota bacterium]